METEQTVEMLAEKLRQMHISYHMNDMACKVNEKEWRRHLVCAADLHMAEGFNPKMGFQRMNTLMEGQDHCNHFFFM